MEILIAIVLIIAAIVVIGFWSKNPELTLSRCSCQRLLDPYEDEENDDATMGPSGLMTK
jgi:hypothetical protein